MLFSKDIERLYEDGFEGSNEERQIFMEVFYGSSVGNATNSCRITGTTNFEVEASRPINALVCSNSENSVLTTQSSIKDFHVEGSCTTNDDIGHVKRNHVGISRGVAGSGCAQECPAVNVGRDEHHISVKRMRCSGDELSTPSNKCSNDHLLCAEKDLIQLDSGKEVVRGMPTPDSHSNDPTITCHLVESSSQGIIRSCYLHKQHREVDSRVHLDDGEATNHTPLSLIGKKANEFSDSTAIISPVSQHIIAPEDLVGGAFDAHKFGHLLVPLERSQEPFLENSDIINISPKRNFLKDLNLRLRSHINNLLIATGWCLEKRKKDCRNYFDTVYISPKGKIFRQFHSVWSSCGESLFVGRYKMMREENVKQWVGINEYSSDLSDTLRNIEKDMQPTEPSFALAHLWSVLDPFATVVFIGKQIGAIRKGKPVNVHRTVVVDLSKGKDIVASKNVGGIGDQLIGSNLTEGLVSANESGNADIHANTFFHGTPLIAGVTEVANGNEHHLIEHCRKGSFSVFGEQGQEGEVKALQSVSPYKKDENTEFIDAYIVDATVNQLAGAYPNPGVQREEFRDQSGSLSCSLVPIQRLDLPGIVADTCLYDVPVLLGTVDTVCDDPRNVLPPHGNDVSVSSFCEQTTGSVESVEDGNREDTQSEGESMKRTMNQLQGSLQDQLDIFNEIPVPVGHSTSTSRHFDTCLHCNSLVAEAVETMVKAIENACNQKGGTETFSAHCQQTCRNNLKVQRNSGGSKRPDGEAARFIPNRFDDKNLNNMEENYSEYEHKNLLISSGEEDIIMPKSTISQLGGSSVNDSLPLGCTTVQSKSEDLITNQSSCMDETIQRIKQVELPSFDLNVETSAVDMLNEEANGRAQEILSPSRRCGELVIGSQIFEKSATNQQKPVLYPQEQVLCEAELAQGSMLEIDKEVSLHHDIQSSACLRSPSKNCCSDVDCKMTGNQDSSLYEVENLPDHQISSENLEPSGHLEDVGSRDSEISNLEMQQTSAMAENSLMKKPQKKSKKISEIKVTKLYSKCSKLVLSTPPRVDPHNCQEGKPRRQSRKVQMFCEGNVRKNESHESSLSVSSSQHKIAKGSRFKNVKHRDSGSEQLAVVSDDAQCPMKPNFVNNTDEVHVHANSGFVNSAICRKSSKSKRSEVHNENGRKRLHECQIDDDDLLIAAIIINKEFSSNSKQPPLKPRKSKALRKLKSQKGSCKLLPRSPGKGGKHYMDGKWSSTGARTVLSWLVDVGVIPLNDVIQFRSLKNDTVIKDGWVTKDGILCKCCSKVLSVSEFKVHAGFKLHRPCLNLFLESGKSYTLCLLQAWSAEYKTRKGGKQAMPVDEVDQNDDTCGLCGDGGELICCDNCPSTFHQTCLSAQELPEGSWYCPNCTCEICGDVVTDKEASSSLAVLKCTQCDHKYHGACIKDSDNCKVVSDKWFCGAKCQEIYTGFRSRVGNVNLIDDGFSWTLLRCIHGDQKVRSAQRFALMAECNSKLAVALTIMEECFLSMVDPRTGINMIPQVIYNWGSNFARLNFQGFYTVILEKEDEIISVASIRVHGVTVAEMPLVATRTEHRRQGMCRQLINAVEEFLTSLKVERLVVAAIPSLVDTWTLGFGFEPMEDKEREQLNSINLMVFPGTTLLTKDLYEREATEIKDGPGDAYTTGREGSTKRSVCFDQKVIQEAGPDMSALLDLKKMRLEEEGSCGEKHMSSFELSVSNFGRNEQEIISNVERCCPRIVTSGMYDGSQRLSTEQ